MSNQRILIIGATSAIAEATARIWATRGCTLCLVARDTDRLQAIAQDLVVRGAAGVDTRKLDVTDFAAHAETIEHALATLGTIDVTLIAHGMLPDQARCQADAEYALDGFSVNCTATIGLTSRIAQKLDIQGHGTLAVISSVAGDRGRASNYWYGAAKAAVNAFLSGLRQRLAKRGVNVITIKPGFVDTPMTVAFKKGTLWASPEQVARGIIYAIDHRRAVVYLPRFWRIIMIVIESIPEFAFRRLKL